MAGPDLPNDMLACQVVEFNKSYKIHRVPVPSPSSLAPGDVLVKIAVASLCHTDSMVVKGVFGSKLPQTASHEGAGTVVARGSEVKNLEVGDRVMCGLNTHLCGKCRSCKGPEQNRHYCPNKGPMLGITGDGMFAEYCVTDAAQTNKLPDEVSFESAAPLACAGRTIYRGVVQAGLKEGEWLALIGSGGGLGHLGIKFAKALGLKVVAIDARDVGLELSRQCGADLVVDARKDKEEVVTEVQNATGGEGCPVSITISEAASAAPLACAVTMMHGRMIQIAQPKDIAVPFEEFIFRDIKIEGSLLCSAQQSQDMLELVAKNKISAKTDPVHGLEKIPELIKLVESGQLQGKGIVIVDEEATKKEKEGMAEMA